LQVWLPGDEQRYESQLPSDIRNWNGPASENRFLFVSQERVSQFVGAPLNALAVNHFRGAARPSAMAGHLLGAIAQDLSTGSPAGQIVGEQIAAALLSWLGRSSFDTPDRSSSGERFTNAHLHRLIEFVDHRLESQIQILELAEITGMNIWQLCRALKTATGLTPSQFVQARRLDRARQLLEDRRLSLVDIALRCGYSDQSHFTRQFRAKFGAPPSAWLKRT